MLDYAAKSSISILCGKQGSGKTTFGLRYLVNVQGVLCRFIFDPEGEYAHRLKLAAAETPEELEFALADGFVIYDPHTMFPGNLAAAFAYFCQWTFATSERCPGRKVLLVDEVWKYCNPHTIPTELALCLQTGRKRGLELMFCTQRPNRLNEAISNEATEIICFRLMGPNALKWAEFAGFDSCELQTIAPGAYVALNCDSGAESRGKVF